MDWTRTGRPTHARHEGWCPHPDCPHENRITVGQTIVRLRVPKARHRELEGTWGRRYERREVWSWAHLECTEEPEVVEQKEYEPPVCDCGASLVVDGEVLLRCGECS